MNPVQQLFGTQSPVALVTGSGSRRVGNAIARHLAKQGFSIGLHYHHSDETAQQTIDELHHQGTDAIALQAAIDSSDQIEQMFAQMDAHFSRIDVLVNSAAIWKPKRFEQITAEDVREYLNVNTLGSFLAAQAAGKRMVAQDRGGVIVNIGDWATERPYLDHAAYFPSKGAIAAMTRSLALELGWRNPHVRVNAILPGPVMLADTVSDEVRRANEQSTLVRRVGTAQHVAHAVQFLIENDFVTGVCLPVDGGRTIFAGDPMQVQHRCG